MDNELEVIRDEMETTRASLAGKLEALENQVRDTVSGASEAVSSTVEGVKDVVSSVSDTVGSVTDTFNIPKQVEERPWVVMGVALATGVAAGYLLSGSRKSAPAYTPTPDLPLQPVPYPAPVQTAPPPPPPPPEPRSEEPGLFDKLMPDMTEVMKTAITGVSGLAIGSLMGVVRELVSSGMPEEWRGDLTSMVDQITTKLGGKVMQPLPRQSDDQPPATAESEQDRLARLEELPSPLPDRPEGTTQTGGGEANPRSRRGGRSQVGSAT